MNKKISSLTPYALIAPFLGTFLVTIPEDARAVYCEPCQTYFDSCIASQLPAETCLDQVNQCVRGGECSSSDEMDEDEDDKTTEKNSLKNL